MAETSIVISKERVLFIIISAANDFQMEVQCFYCYKFQAIYEGASQSKEEFLSIGLICGLLLHLEVL